MFNLKLDRCRKKWPLKVEQHEEALLNRVENYEACRPAQENSRELIYAHFYKSLMVAHSGDRHFRRTNFCKLVTLAHKTLQEFYSMHACAVTFLDRVQFDGTGFLNESNMFT